MSKELVKPETPDSGFAGEGFTPFPSLMGDLELVKGIGDYILDRNLDPQPRYSDVRIAEWIKQYSDFVKQPDTMPRAKATATQIGRHLVFEKMWRAGLFEKAPDDSGELA